MSGVWRAPLSPRQSRRISQAVAVFHSPRSARAARSARRPFPAAAAAAALLRPAGGQRRGRGGGGGGRRVVRAGLLAAHGHIHALATQVGGGALSSHSPSLFLLPPRAGHSSDMGEMGEGGGRPPHKHLGTYRAGPPRGAGGAEPRSPPHHSTSEDVHAQSHFVVFPPLLTCCSLYTHHGCRSPVGPVLARRGGPQPRRPPPKRPRRKGAPPGSSLLYRRSPPSPSLLALKKKREVPRALRLLRYRSVDIKPARTAPPPH